MGKGEIKAGQTRWFAMTGKSSLRGAVHALQIISRKGNRIVVRCFGFPDLIYTEKTILKNTFSTYRKAQQFANKNQRTKSL